MFLCDPCHAKANCPMPLFEDIAARSRGRCESCGNVAACIDCHHYGEAVAQVIDNTPKVPYATTGTVTKVEPAHGWYQAGEIGWIAGDDGRTYQYSGFGAETGPNYHEIAVVAGDRVSFRVTHVGGEGFLKYPLVVGLEHLRKARDPQTRKARRP